MSTSKRAVDRPAGTMTQALVRVQEDGARLTSTASVLPDDRSMVTTPETVEPARTGSGRSTATTAAVREPTNEQLTPPPAEAGPADVRPTVPTLSSRTGRASTGCFMGKVLLEVTGPFVPYCRYQSTSDFGTSSPGATVEARARPTDGDPMSMATRTDTQSPARHVADRHELIRVHGARVNNLKDVSIEIPKRRLTVFTGVSGSGKSSLVFGTIAAESQRLINETYSAFVQGFMPTLARPDVDVLEGLTTAILVDQERMGADARSTVGTATDANALLRVLFSRLGQPHIGSPNAFSFNVPSVRARGGITIERGATKTVKATFDRTGGMCPRCEGMGSVTDFDLSQLYDDSKSLNEGALTIPGYSMDGWFGRIFSGSGFFDMDKPIGKFSKKELNDLLYREPVKIKVEGINLTYEGIIPKIQKSMLSKDPEAMQSHVRAFVERAVTFQVCPECEGTRLAEPARSSKIGKINIADACSMQISDLAGWVGGLKEPSVAPLLAGLKHNL